MSHPTAHLEWLPRSVQLTLACGLVALASFPFVGSDFYAQMVARMMIMAIFAMSLDLLQGVTGLVSLGHAAYFGVAGYTLAFLTPQGEPVSLWWTLPVAVLGSAAAALVIGFHPAVFQSNHTLHCASNLSVVSNQNQRSPGFTMQGHDQVHDLLPRGGIEVARGFIGKENGWTSSKGPRDGDTLLFTTRKLHRIVMHSMR